MEISLLIFIAIMTIIQVIQKIKIMGKLEDMLAKQDQIDNVIGEVKKDLDFIKAKLAAGTEGGLSPEEASVLDARLDSTLARLSALDAETDSSAAES